LACGGAARLALIRELRQAGRTYAQIGGELDVSRRTIARALDRAGFERPNVRPKPPR
jgi:hypothetical protein